MAARAGASPAAKRRTAGMCVIVAAPGAPPRSLYRDAAPARRTSRIGIRPNQLARRPAERPARPRAAGDGRVPLPFRERADPGRWLLIRDRSAPDVRTYI